MLYVVRLIAALHGLPGVQRCTNTHRRGDGGSTACCKPCAAVIALLERYQQPSLQNQG